MLTKFGIHIKVRDIEKSLSFYKHLGFEPVFAYGSKDFLKQFEPTLPTAPERYQGVTFELGGSLLEIADGHLAVKPSVFREEINTSKVSAMIHVTSIQEIEKVCKKYAYNIAVPAKVFPWGTREIVVIDPDGFVLVCIEKISKV